MASGNHNSDPQTQLTLFEEATAPVQPASPERQPNSSSPEPEATIISPEVQLITVHEGYEPLTPEQHEVFERTLELSGFTVPMALGRAGVRKIVTETPAQSSRKRKSAKNPGHRPYVRRSDPDYKDGVDWNLQ